MRSVFVDTGYWIAILSKRDQWQAPAIAAKKALGHIRLVTTDEVLVEFLNAMGERGKHVREAAAKAVRAIIEDVNIEVVPQTRDGFVRGLKRYESRQDKGYSLTDCISMEIMESRGLTDVLGTDHHFAQEGLTVLIKREE